MAALKQISSTCSDYFFFKWQQSKHTGFKNLNEYLKFTLKLGLSICDSSRASIGAEMVPAGYLPPCHVQSLQMLRRETTRVSKHNFPYMHLPLWIKPIWCSVVDSNQEKWD